jgi:hypothetical protein
MHARTHRRSAHEGGEGDSGPGRPLDPVTRAHFEPLLGHDFAQVRIYPDSQAPTSFGAAALTVGDDLAFAPGRYAPETAAGQRLLAHELTHVVQQRHAPRGARSVHEVGVRSDAAEREAEQVGDRAGAGAGPGPGPVTISATPSAVVAPGLLDWAEDAVSDVGGLVSDAGSAVAGVASEAWDETKEVGSGIYSGMKENAGLVKDGTQWLEGGIDWLEGEASGGAHWLADKAEGIPILGDVASAGAWAVDQQAQLTGGILKGATGLLGGVGSMIANPVDAAIGLEKMAEHIPMGVPNPFKMAHGLYDVVANDASLGDVANKTLNPMASMEDDAAFFGQMAKGVAKPYQEAIARGKYSEAIGHGVFDIGALILTGGESGAADAGLEGAALAAEVGEGAGALSTIAEGAEGLNAVAEGTEALSAVSEGTEAMTALTEGGSGLELATDGAGAGSAGVLEPHPFEITEGGLTPLDGPKELPIPDIPGKGLEPSGLDLADEGSLGGGSGGGGGGGGGGGAGGPESLDNPAHNASDFERLKAQYAQEEILGAEPTGSALKGGSGHVRSNQVMHDVEIVAEDGTTKMVQRRLDGVRNVSTDVDVNHSAPIYEQGSIAENGRMFSTRGADGKWRNLTQMPGNVNGADGIFEYIVDEKGQLVHQEFRPDKAVTGIPGGGTMMKNP